MLKLKSVAVAAAVASLLAAAPAFAQTKLKWGHVYETSEAFHTEASGPPPSSPSAPTTNTRSKSSRPRSSARKPTSTRASRSARSTSSSRAPVSPPARFPPIGVGYYPFTFKSPEHLLAYAKSDVFKELAKGYEEKTGHVITATTYYGTRHTTSNRAFKACADMKGLKIRVPDVPAYLAYPRACGANTTPIAFAEVYLALQNGTVEAQENPLTTIEAKKFYEVQKHIVLTGHIVDAHQHRRRQGHLGQVLGRRTEDLH